MTYKELVDNFRQIAEDHYMIQDFGYGQLSDIKSAADGSEADYPYMFLNPTSHTRTERTIVYRFNLIMMEISNDDSALQTQSDCGRYIDDVLAELKYNYERRTDLAINVALTPFKERFQDVVAGMTAAIEIEVPNKLDLCIAPFTPDTPPTPPVTETLVLNVITTIDNVRNPDSGQSPLRFDNVVLDTYTGWRPDLKNFYNPTSNGDADYKYVLTGSARIQNNYVTAVDVFRSNGGQFFAPDQIVGWPSQAEWTDGAVFSFTLTWDSIAYTAGNWQSITFPDEPAIEGTVTVFTGADLKAYEIE